MAPVNNRGSLDPRWTRHHTPVVAGFMSCDIRVWRNDPNGGSPTYDPTTRKWTVPGAVQIWAGKARVQPYGILGDQVVAQDPTGRRLMRVQIEDLLSGIQLDDMLQVTNCPADPELELYQMEVRGAIGSSNSWVTDIVAEANLKYTETA